MNRLKNKTALITGAAGGIGLAIADAFVREGATTVLTDIRDELGQSECDRLHYQYFVAIGARGHSRSGGLYDRIRDQSVRWSSRRISRSAPAD